MIPDQECTPHVSISLVSHNQRNDLERLFPSLKKAAQRLPHEIFLVSNRSSDGSAEFARLAFPEIRTTENHRIAGYGENHNLNLKHACGRYFVVMNSDMTIASDIFISLRDYMDLHPDIGIVTPKVLNPDGSIQGLNKRYPTVFDLFLRRFIPDRLHFLIKRRNAYYEMRDVGYDRECEVPFISGAFMFCRTELLKSLGGFDERFFLYFEDIDLCRRIQRTHRTVYYPHATATHFWARAAQKKWKFTCYFIRSAWRYFSKWGFKLY